MVTVADWLILQVPYAAVFEGEPLVLRCRGWYDKVVYKLHYYRDGQAVRYFHSSTNYTVPQARASDSGRYQCSGTMRIPVESAPMFSSKVAVTVQGGEPWSPGLGGGVRPGAGKFWVGNQAEEGGAEGGQVAAGQRFLCWAGCAFLSGSRRRRTCPATGVGTGVPSPTTHTSALALTGTPHRGGGNGGMPVGPLLWRARAVCSLPRGLLATSQEPFLPPALWSPGGEEP